jgi:hypothetical protein
MSIAFGAFKRAFSKAHLLVTPGILHGSAVLFVSHIVFAITGGLLTG